MALIAGSAALMLRGTDTTTCVTSPITLTDLNAAIARTAEPFPESVPAADRSPVSRGERSAVERVLDQLVACSNAGEPLRVWSLYAPDYLARIFLVQGPFGKAAYAAYAEPMPAEGEGMELVEIVEVWRRGDGIYGAEVEMRYPSVPMPKRLIVWMDGNPLRIAEITGEISFSLP